MASGQQALTASCKHWFVILCFMGIGLWVHAAQPLRIKSENVNIQVRGIKPEFITFTWEVEVVYEILDPENLDLLKQYRVPQTIDPTFQPMAPEHWTFDFFIDDVKIENFLAERSSDGRSWSKLKSKAKLERGTVFNPLERTFVDPFITTYSLVTAGLKKGDLVRITYAWEAPMIRNPFELWSIRLFHHSFLDKESYDLTISYPKELQWRIDYMNGDLPDRVREAEHKRVEEQWHRENLPGCLHEIQSRPYTELPYVQLSFNRMDMYASFRSLGSGQAELPTLFALSSERTKGFWEDVSAMKNGIFSKNAREFRMLEAQVCDSSDSPIQRMVKMHHHMVKDFGYDPSIKVYKRNGAHNQVISKALDEQVLSDAIRHRLYVAMFYHTNSGGALAYAMDKRSGVLSNYYFKGAALNDFFFAAMDPNGIRLFLPKTNRTGFFSDELPFYLQGTEITLLGNVHPDRLTIQDGKVTIGQTIPVTIPANTLAENTRQLNARITVAENASEALVQGRLNLSGQYSTLTRSLYLHNEQVHRVPDFYYTPIWQGVNDSASIQMQVLSSSETSPFLTSFKCTYKLPASDPNRYQIGAWLNHLIPSEPGDSERTLAYYPDFQGSDVVSFQLDLQGFDGTLTLPENVLIENEYGSYQLEVSTGDNNLINVYSKFVIKSNQIPADGIDQVSVILKAARAAREASILCIPN